MHRALALARVAGARTLIYHVTAAEAVRAEAEQYSSALRADAESHADQTLADLLDVLGRTSTTTEQGRQALLSRRQTPGTDRSIS